MTIKTLSLNFHDRIAAYGSLMKHSILTQDDISKIKLLRESSGFDFRS